jgi:hypothetical protein
MRANMLLEWGKFKKKKKSVQSFCGEFHWKTGEKMEI